ncbi:extracellular solute-binding protein [Paenibacillus eucommiae]|uniref:Multiple sugar transport system substrate-binding protein n=1 Tax=Paenibacillus eucommiae TaxID=1355755 RepID=A0ABS4J1U1_9BACL|nr:extracellular solute-binding protein [Paenibacillus eucommiae]MBP1993783.1 multiple sugar transport system substrate-binding protein [Paenibacillus eucommiae]
MQRENDFLYQGLADMLRSQIHSSLVKPGSLLLSENEMCAKYNVSRTSVRKALAILLEEKLIIKQHGKGTMVSPTFKSDDTDSNTLVILVPYPSNYASKGFPILIRLFQERYPETKFRVIPVSYEDDTFLQDLLQFGIIPDLILVGDSDFQQLSHHGFCPLDEMVKGISDIPPNLLEVYKQEGRLYALPVTYSPVYLAYNNDLFSANSVEAPSPSWTFEQLIDAAKKLTIDIDGDALKEIYGFAINNQLNRWVPFLINRLSFSRSYQAVDAVSEEDNFDWQLFKDVLESLQEAIYVHQISPVYSVGDPPLTQWLFEQGHIAMILTTTLAFNLNPLQFGMASLPFGTDQSHVIVSNAMLITEFSKRQELAKRFLSLTLEPEVQREISSSTGLLAVSLGINQELLQENQLTTLGLTEGVLDNSKFIHQVFPDIDNWDKLIEEMKYFWAGLESAPTLIERLKTLNLFK